MLAEYVVLYEFAANILQHENFYKGVIKMFCSICGKELQEGETCTCQQGVNAQPAAENVQPAETQTESAQQEAPVSSLPSGSELAEGAKNAAQAVKNNPIVADVLNVIKGAFKDPVKQTVECAKRKDILWVILAVIETLVFSLASMVFVKRSLYFFVSIVASNIGTKVGYGKTSELLGDLGVTSGKLFGVGVGTYLITLVITVILMMLSVLVCKHKAGFSQTANMLTGAFLPSTILLAVSIIVSMLCAPISLLLFFAAYICFIILAYLGMQKLDKFTVSPFKVYTVFAVLFTAVASFVSLRLSGNMVVEIIDELMSSLNSLSWLF